MQFFWLDYIPIYMPLKFEERLVNFHFSLGITPCKLASYDDQYIPSGLRKYHDSYRQSSSTNQ